MKDISVDWLKSIESLKGVPAEQLQWFIDRGKLLTLAEGETITKPGELIPGPLIIISGKVRLCVISGQELHEVGTYESGSIGGNLPFSRARIAPGVLEVVEDVVYFQFPLEEMKEMIRSQFELTQALVHVMSSRIRDYTAFEQQNEKMMALGKLSAGLAHELNNPAAAVVRGSASLTEHLELSLEPFKEILALHLEEKEIGYVTNKLFSRLSATEKPVLSMLQRSSLEDDLSNWFYDNGLPGSADTAENLVDFGFGPKDLDELKTNISPRSIPILLSYINSRLVTEKIVGDIREASGRIAGLVGAVKTFTHMDQGHGKQYGDIHTGIRNTLTMLQHKVRNGNVTVIENFDSTLPEVKAMIGELNQVWTNILDNALDAMQPHGRGTLTITTGRAKDCVKVTISDSGPGIPEEIRSRIFDPFFTTKQIGKGTGLGLDVALRIVRQHKGAVKVQSSPGQTDFIVEFPIDG